MLEKAVLPERERINTAGDPVGERYLNMISITAHLVHKGCLAPSKWLAIASSYPASHLAHLVPREMLIAMLWLIRLMPPTVPLHIRLPTI